MKNKWLWVGMVLILTLSALLHFLRLENRPPHHDESINGWFIERLLNDPKDYTYSPEHYHGPTFFYLGAFSAKHLGLRLFSLRLVTALFGFALCFAPLLLINELGIVGVLIAMFLFSTAPAFVFYSRYAIHETLLVALFTYFAIFLYRYIFYGERILFYFAALLFGIACATKETVVIYAAGVGLGLVGALLFQKKPPEKLWAWLKKRFVTRNFYIDAAYFGVLFAFGLFLFFKKAEVVAFFKSYFFYAKLGTKHTGHEKPWPYFFAYFPRDEWFLMLGALGGGMYAAIRRTRLSLFCLFWAGVVFTAHSLIPYKTPWIIINLMVPLVFLTGEWVNALWVAAKGNSEKSLVVLCVGILAFFTVQKSYSYSFVEFYEPINRYAYVQTVESARTIANKIKSILDLNPEEQVDFLSDPEWPYPFLLAGYKKVYYWRKIVDPISAKIVVARDSQYADVLPKLKKNYTEEKFNVRPGLDMILFIAEDELKMPSKP